MDKESNNVPFIKTYLPIINSNLDIYEERILSIIISYEKKGTGISMLSKKVFNGISVSKIQRTIRKFENIGLLKRVNSKSETNHNNPTEYHLNKKKINEYFNCKIYDIKEQVCDREPEIKSKVVSQFEMFLNSKTIKNKK